MEQLTLEEWRGYLHKIETCDYPLPSGIIGEYNDWRNRSIVGRMLFVLKDIEGAMRVLSTVRSIEPDPEDDPEYGMSEVEHKTLCLRDLGEIVWLLAGQADAALGYFDAAYAYCRSFAHPFRSANRGRIWLRRLEIKRDSGRQAEAMQEALAMLEQEAANAGVNPYRFYAYKFLAEAAAAQGDCAKACLLLEEAYKSFPESRAAQKDLAAAAAEADVKERCAKYLHCTEIQYVPWEKLPVPDVDEVRRRQYAKYLERQQKEQEKQQQQQEKK